MTPRSTLLATAGAAALAFAALAAAFSAGATATTMRPPAQPTAVATVDLVAVLEGLSEKTVLEQRLEQSLADRQKQLDTVVEQIRTAQADLETLKAGTAGHREKVRQILELRAVADARRNALQQIISIEKGEMLQGIYAKITAAIAKLSERQGLDLVLLDDSAFPLPANASDRDIERAILTRSIIHRHNALDITQQVVQLMNNEFGG